VIFVAQEVASRNFSGGTEWRLRQPDVLQKCATMVTIILASYQPTSGIFSRRCGVTSRLTESMRGIGGVTSRTICRNIVVYIVASWKQLFRGADGEAYPGNENIVKRFPGVLANNNANLTIHPIPRAIASLGLPRLLVRIDQNLRRSPSSGSRRGSHQGALASAILA